MATFTKEVNFGAKDRFNAVGASKSLQTLAGTEINVCGLAFATDTNDDGKEMQVAYIKTDDGLASTISETAIRSLSELLDYDEFLNGEVVTFKVIMRPSNNGREFLTLEMV